MTVFTAMDAVSRLEENIYPGVFHTIDRGRHIPLGGGSLTTALPFLWCLSPDEDATSPGDIPVSLMPPWAAWALCSIVDSVDETTAMDLSVALREVLDAGISVNQWADVQKALFMEWHKLTVVAVLPVLKALELTDHIQRLGKLQEAVASGNPQAIIMTTSRSFDVGYTDILSDETMAPVLAGDTKAMPRFQLDEIARMADRTGIFMARAVFGDGEAVRRGLLDLDFGTTLCEAFSTGMGFEPAKTMPWHSLAGVIMKSFSDVAAVPVQEPLLVCNYRRPQSPSM